MDELKPRIPSINDVSVRWKIAGNLLLILLIMVANVAGVWLFLQEQEDDEAIINTAGRQRFLVQQMTTEAHLIGMGKTGHRDDLAAAAATYNRSLTTLIEGNESMGIGPAPPGVRRQLLQVRSRWIPFHERIKTITTAPRSSQEFQSALEYVQTHNRPLLLETDAAVDEYEVVFSRKNQQLRSFLELAVILDVVAVALLILFSNRRVIRPINRLVTEARAIADGDLDRTVDVVHGADEVGQLTRAIEAMRRRLVTSLQRARGFQQAIEHAGHAIVITDTDGTIEYVNPAFEAQSGHDRGGVLGDHLSVLTADSRDDGSFAELWDTVLSGGSWEGELVSQHHDGGEYYVEQTIAPIIDESGDIERVVAVNKDITRLKQLESTLRGERDRFAALFENVPEPAVDVVVERGGWIVKAVNPAFESIFGYDSDSIVGEPLHDFILPPETDGIETGLLEDRCRPDDHSQTEVQRQTIDGVRYFLLRTARISGGERPRCYAIYTDITARRQRERALERQNERLDDFASIVSHDLRNPLSVAHGHLDLVRDECSSRFLDPIDDALTRMNALIDDLLTLAREGKPVDSVDPVPLQRAVWNAWSMVVDSDAATLVVADDLGTLLADESRLRQLFENLFRNAIDHGGPDVTITVGRVDETGFYVSDDGPGIPAEKRDEVFQAGYSTLDEGTGFGLNIVDEIAEAHGWSITVGDGSDGGARFEISDVEFRSAHAEVGELTSDE